MNYEPAVIRHFLIQRFDDEELRHLCFDYFPDVYHDFTIGMRKGQMVQLLLDYCQRRGRLPDLMAALERERPSVYQEHFGSRSAPVSAHDTPPQRNPRQIFISHAHQDSAFARRLAADLLAQGWPIWLALDNIWAGEKWVEAINRGLEESGIFVLVLTQAAVQSRWVRSETGIAIGLEHQGKMRLLPVQLEPCEAPAVWHAYQWIPFNTAYETGLRQLLAALPGEKRPFHPEAEAEKAEKQTSPPHKQSRAERPLAQPPLVWLSVAVFLVIALLLAGWRLGWWGGAAVPTADNGGEQAISLNETVNGTIGGADTDTWIYTGDPDTVDIVVASNSPNDSFILSVFSQTGERRIYADFLGAGEGELVRFFELQPDDQILVDDSENDGASYSLTIRPSTPERISLGQAVTDTVIGANPAVYLYDGGPVTADVVLEMAPTEQPVLIVIGPDGRELANLTTADAEGRVVFSHTFIAGEYTFIVRDVSNDGANYTIRMMEAAAGTAETAGALLMVMTSNWVSL